MYKCATKLEALSVGVGSERRGQPSSSTDDRQTTPVPRHKTLRLLGTLEAPVLCVNTLSESKQGDKTSPDN
ncbi:hypothetical protein E2C01_061650 [Portunus trituberculatus]|uniref:Uncharacterized protein n=1 Tax=Portunus trituberculatus TaxID=210409 RepID=A0A5B7HFN5_PORTR|nr:hypothetical protein [Portunus trituberculatus]